VRFESLTDDEAGRIHDAALGLLEEVGLQLAPASAAADRLRAAGVAVSAAGRVLLSRAAVAEALRAAPRVIRLGGRAPRPDAVLDRRRTWVTTDGCGAMVVDLETGARRPAVLADVMASARLTDALDRFDIYWLMVSAQDVPLAGRVPREYLAALRHTTKHVQMIDITRPEEAAGVARLAAAVGEAGLATAAPVSALISVVSPLRLDPGGLEAAAIFAAAGLPVAACSMPIAGVTSPATAAGTVMQAHAEIIGFLAILERLVPGAPVIYCSFPAFAHPRTGVANYRDPRRFWAMGAATRLGRRLDLPTFTSGELASLLEGPDLLCFGGLLEVSTLLSYEQMVIDHEILRDMLLAAAPQPVDDDTLGLEVVREVGPGGHFLTRPHTIRHIREFVVPRFAEGERPVEPDAAAGAGGRPRVSPREQARQEARRLLASHAAPPLPADLDARLEALIPAPSVRA
jgi:trimethylamine--corrinoid protein Co-methyltransferase